MKISNICLFSNQGRKIQSSLFSLMDHQTFITSKTTNLLPFNIFNRQIFCSLSLLFIFISSIAILNVIPQSPRFPFFFTNNSSACDYSYGKWVRDQTRQLQFYRENCPFLDPGFRCRSNGRKDKEYLNWRWQPYGCHLPRFNASDVLERSRNGRIVFAGDSIGRNQWESLICMLSQTISNLSTIYEVNGNPISKHKGFLSMRFSEYNLTVEYYRTPFLATIAPPPPNSTNEVKTTIKVDELHKYSKMWVGADILVFNAGHWWNEEKTTKMGYYFQEGGKVDMGMNVSEAFQRTLKTWRSWSMNNLDPDRTRTFFRTYSPVHYRNGTWNEGGLCDANTEPEKNYKNLEPEPLSNGYIFHVVNQMGSHEGAFRLLNISYMTEFRKDAHPSLHREPGTPVNAPQDCSHWCLPGVPDTWNELLYAYLLDTRFKTR